MINDSIGLTVYMNPARNTYDVYLHSTDGVKTIARPVQIIFEDSEPGTYHEPSFSFSPEVAQRLMDQLWTAGLRPNNGEGGPAQVAAMAHHLADMRAIVARQLGVQLREASR